MDGMELQVDVHALQMEYAQQQINEDPFYHPWNTEQEGHPDVEMGDSGNVHDVSRARHNSAICRPIGGL